MEVDNLSASLQSNLSVNESGTATDEPELASIVEELEELLAENGPVGSLRRHFAESSSATLANLEFHDRVERIQKLLAPLLARFEEFCKKESEEKRDFFSSALRRQIMICELAAKIFKELQVKKSELVELSAIFADEVDILFSATCSLSAHASNSMIGTHLRKLLSQYENMVLWAYHHKIESDNTRRWFHRPMSQFLQLLKSSHNARNLISLFGILLAIPNRIFQEALVETLAHFYETDEISPDAMANSFVRAFKLVLAQNEIVGEEKMRKMEKNVQALLNDVLKTPRKWFLKNIIPMMKKIGKSAQVDKELEKSLYKVYYFMRNNGASVPNRVMVHQAETIMLLLTPNLPSGLERENFDAEFFGQFRLLLNSMIAPDFEMRIAAIEKFKVWTDLYWESLIDYQLKNVAEGFQSLAKLMLHHESCAKTVEAALKTLTGIVNDNPNAHALIYDIFAGDEEFKNRSENSINVSRVIAARNVKVRLAFLRLLRSSNKTVFVKWNHICSPLRVYKRLLDESDSQVKSEAALLLRHSFFKAKDEKDKEGIIETIKTLTKLYNESSKLCMVLIPEILDCWEDLGWNVKLLLGILRKLGHLVKHEISQRQKAESNDNPSEMVVLSASMMIGAAFFRSQYMAKVMATVAKNCQQKENGEELSKEAEENMKLMNEVDGSWKSITEKAFNLDHDDKEMKLAVVFLSGIWKSNDIDLISIPLRGAIRHGGIDPSVMVQAMVKWNRLADVWCQINEWFKTQTGADAKSAGVRFEVEDEETLKLEHVIQYIRAMSDYKSTFGHKEAAETYVQISGFMKKFFAELKSSEKLSDVFEDASPEQLQYLAQLRYDLNIAKGAGEEKLISDAVDFSEYADILVSEKLRYGNEEKLYAIFLADMKKIALSLRETVSVLTPNWAIEEQFCGILEENKNLVRKNLTTLRQFIEALIRFKLDKEKKKGHFYCIVDASNLLFKTMASESGLSKTEKSNIQGHFDFLCQVSQENLRQTVDIAFMDFLKEDNIFLKPFRDHLCNKDLDHLEIVWSAWIAKEGDQNMIDIIRDELSARLKFKRPDDCPLPGTHLLFPAVSRPSSSLSHLSDDFDNDEPLCRRP